MTQVTPPGWYADPGQTNDGPPTERWWDGKAWTDQTRPAGPAAAWGPPGQPPAYGAPAAPSAYGAYPGYGYPAQPPAGPRRGLRIGIAVAAAVAVLASIGVGAYALTHDDGGKDQATSRQQRPDGPGGDSGGPGGDSPSPAPSEAPKVKGGGTVQDPFNGISMPVPEGWTGQTIRGGAAITSDHAYKCPGAASQQCTPGGAYSAPALVLGTKGDTAEQVARADIAANAKQSYGGSAYGGITSHQVLAAKSVTVAGQKGYLVRWKAVTSKGADGYVESLAFPSPNDAKQIVVVRFGVDVGQPLSVIDDVTKGIKVSSGGGNGQSV